MSETSIKQGKIRGFLPLGPRRGITLRALLLGVLLIPLNIYFIIELEVVRSQSFPTVLGLLMNSLFVLFLFALLNLPLRRCLPRFVFSPAELLTMYIMVNIGTVLSGSDQIQILVSMLGHATYFASPENRWADLFLGHLPDWLVVKDKEVLRGFYIGQSTLFTPSHLQAWQGPMLWWGGFTLTLFWVFLCLNTLLRKQWADRERLTFPLVQMPVAIASDPGFFRSKAMWIGFGLSSVIAVVNGINRLNPNLPGIPTRMVSLTPVNRPWSGLGYTAFWIHPFVIGLAMLMPTELSFSTWFFYWFQQFQTVAAQVTGFDNLQPGFPFLAQQSLGAVLGIALFALWSERRYFLSVLHRACGLPSDLDDANEPLRYRFAIIGMLVGLLLLFFFSLRAGLSPLAAVLFLVLYFTIALGVTRLRAELGAPAHDLNSVGTDYLLVDAAGAGAFSRSEHAVLGLYGWFNMEYGGHPMPVQLEGFKMGERSQAKPRRLVAAMMIAAVVGTVGGLLIMTDQMYRLGATSGRVLGFVQWYGDTNYGVLQARLEGMQRPHLLRTGGYAFGLLFSLLLMALRIRLPNWPFHPLGLAMAAGLYLRYIWFSIFIGWFVKLLLMRYGGQKGYLMGLPFFMGLILGDCVWGSIWLISGMLFRVQTYNMWI